VGRRTFVFRRRHWPNDSVRKCFLQRQRRVRLIPGSTRVSRVQFGVPPNCGGGRTSFERRSRLVSGATPETARGTRALPEKFPRAGLKHVLESFGFAPA
jgi:hypothetical protein